MPLHCWNETSKHVNIKALRFAFTLNKSLIFASFLNASSMAAWKWNEQLIVIGSLSIFKSFILRHERRANTKKILNRLSLINRRETQKQNNKKIMNENNQRDWESELCNVSIIDATIYIHSSIIDLLNFNRGPTRIERSYAWQSLRRRHVTR